MRSTWSVELLPTSVTTGVSASTSARRLASSSQRMPARRVLPNAATLARGQRRPRGSGGRTRRPWGSSPASRPRCSCTPSPSSARAIFTLSSTESERPSRWVPSRRVVSYRRIASAAFGSTPGVENASGLSRERPRGRCWLGVCYPRARAPPLGGSRSGIMQRQVADVFTSMNIYTSPDRGSSSAARPISWRSVAPAHSPGWYARSVCPSSCPG